MIHFFVGIAALLICSFVIKLESVGAGIMGGGILTLISGSMKYWEYFGELAKFIIVGVALTVLIWIGYKKLNENKAM